MASPQLALSSVDTLQVVEMDARSESRWEAYVTKHPDGSVFHHPAWVQALSRGSKSKPICLACVDVEGQIHGVLPLLETRGFWFNWGPQNTKRRLSSLPRTPLAGPLSDNAEVTAKLARAAVGRVRAMPGVRLELKLPSNDLDGVAEGLVGIPWKENYVVELPESPEGLRFGNSVTRHRIKRAVKKARMLGVEVRPAETEEDLSAWYELYLATMRWHAAIPRPHRFFAALWESLRPKGLMRLLLAEHCREGQRRILAGYFLLMCGRTVHCYVNGRRGEDLGLHPNDILQWEAIHDACREGYRRYNFLEVQEGQRGLIEFKVKWGAKPLRSHRYYYPAPQGVQDASGGSGSRIQRLVTAAWRRVPLRATTLLADWIQGYL